MKYIARIRPAFFRLALITLILIGGLSWVVSPAWASTYAGFNAANAPNNSCNPPSGNWCLFEPSSSTKAAGSSFPSPLTGQLTSISVYTGNIIPNTLVVLTSSGVPAETHNTANCNAFGAGICPWWTISSGQTYTVVDVENVAPSANSFVTLNLATTILVTANQWLAVLFYASSNPGTNTFIVTCNASCDTSFVAGAEIDFATVNPTLGNSYNTVACNTDVCSDGTPVVGASFTATASSGTLIQCYGNCGSPAITLTNSNATKTVAFNQSITIFYDFQSNLNGFILNMTTSLASTANPAQVISLAIYEVAGCPAGNTPFSPSCPGSLMRSTIYGGAISKGRIALTAGPTPLPVEAGQWVGIAISARITGLQLNSTNLPCAANFACNQGLFYATGSVPSTISSSAPCDQPGPCSTTGIDNVGIWGWIQGVTVGPPPTPTTTACVNNFAQLDCLIPGMVNSACSVVTASCQTSGALFWIIILTFLSFLVATVGFSSAHITKFVGAGEVFMFLFLGWFFIFVGVGVLQSFVVIFFLFIGSVAFAKTARNYF